jgi:hypothetical protein
VKLVTWNLNSLKARLPRLLELLGAERPDVVCLQETKTAAGAPFPLELASAGYTAIGHGGGRWGGVAMLLGPGLEPAVVGQGLAGEPDPAEARWLEVEAGPLRVVSVRPQRPRPRHPDVRGQAGLPGRGRPAPGRPARALAGPRRRRQRGPDRRRPVRPGGVRRQHPRHP